MVDDTSVLTPSRAPDIYLATPKYRNIGLTAFSGTIHPCAPEMATKHSNRRTQGLNHFAQHGTEPPG
ncbi:hypothetical protein M378DRAFT_154788 [Amanita muscaria Koide BX008]|uniref:Uncharacterized protein n=1 Tax=Amanita muscaria (strain Koide BX008) TaxID=946122 RepID=A0A0C2XPY0_AMAMK|nr:hypothetical protein M378DRAFT_154788 [Amanita muscaria Koide BX008]